MHAIGDLVGRLDLDLAEPCTLQTRAVLVERQRAGDAADEAPALGPLGGREVVRRDDVADPEAATGAEHAAHLGEHRALSVDRLITQLEMTTSTDASGSGMSSM